MSEGASENVTAPSEDGTERRTRRLSTEGRGEACVTFRNRLEKYISDFDISGDEIQTPKVVLVIGGDARAFRIVRDSLDAQDPSTGLSEKHPLYRSYAMSYR